MVASCELSAHVYVQKLLGAFFCVYLGLGPCLITALRMDGPDSMLPQDVGGFFFSVKVCVSRAALVSSDPQPGTQALCVYVCACVVCDGRCMCRRLLLICV